MTRKLFCELHPICYKISHEKEIVKRHFKNVFGKVKIARSREEFELPNLVKSHTSLLVRRLYGVDIKLQENKVTNIILACKRLNKLVIHPGETFSYWTTLGKPTKRRGFTDGLVIAKNGLTSGIGGGLCQMANMIHYLILNSPLEVTELHHHSDSLFPDEKRRVPFGTGTSVAYNHVDYRFKNTTDSDVQLLLWIEDGYLCGELRSEKKFQYRYRLVEENHFFAKEGKDYYRNSEVYRLVIDRETGKEVARELILKNHSRVMYDHSLIPAEQIREQVTANES